MQVHLKPETESRLQELAAKTGRAPDELVEDAMAGYLQELAQIREEAFVNLRRKSKQRRPRRS